jgi:hypothetical protein
MIAVILVLTGVCLEGCKTREQRFDEEARAEGTKFWESRVFSKCGGEFGDYFGRRDGKIYQFDPIVLAVASKSTDNDSYADYEWHGVTMLMCGKWRTFENGVWRQWQEEKLNWPAPGIADAGRTAPMGRLWINGSSAMWRAIRTPTDLSIVRKSRPFNPTLKGILKQRSTWPHRVWGQEKPIAFSAYM